MQDVVGDVVEQIAVVTDDEDGRCTALEVVAEPQHALEVEVVGRFVQQQQVGLGEEHRGQRHPHPPAAGIFGKRPVLRHVVEAEAAEDAGRAGGGGVSVDIDEPGLDFCDPLRVARAFGFGHERRPFEVGLEHEVDQRLASAGRLLLDAAQTRPLRRADRAAFGGKIAADETEKGGLAGAVAPDEADPRPARQCGGRVVDQQPLAEAVGQAVDMKHGRLLTRHASAGKVLGRTAPSRINT